MSPGEPRHAGGPSSPMGGMCPLPHPAALPLALVPEGAWPVGVRALMSTRAGGVSQAPFDQLNLRPAGLPAAAADAPEAIDENQARFQAALGAPPVWLNQVHGAAVVRLRAQPRDAGPQTRFAMADASVTTEAGVACAVLVADCLPVLFASRCGRVVGAAHAGWRGLAGGVLEATVGAMGEAAGVAPGELIAWLGACIGPEAFEVGAEVVQAFGASTAPADRAAAQAPGFRGAPRPDGAPRWRADLPALARQRLTVLGLHDLRGGGRCTFTEADRFYSFRRQPLTGRMAAAIARGVDA